MRASAHPAARTEETATRPGVRPPERRGVSRETTLQLALLFGPLVLMVALMRLLQYSFLLHAGVSAPGQVLAAAAPAPLLALLGILGVYAALRRVGRPGLRPGGRLALTSLAAALLLTTAAVLAPPAAAEWLSLPAFEVIRWDLLVLLLVALAFLFLLEGTRGWLRRLSLAVLCVLVMMLMLVPAITFGYFFSTGLPADGTLMKYFFLNFPDLVSIASSEIRGAKVLLLLLPLLLPLLPTLLLRLPAVRRWAAAPAPAALPWHALGGALPVLLLLALTPRADLSEAYRVSSYVGLAEGMARNVSAETADEALLWDEAPPPFDTQALRFVPTDSTRRMNVVLIILESTRARSLTPYTPRLDTTPFLDSLARRGLLVEHMYAVTPYTNKALTPMLAGIYSYPHRRVVEALPGGVPGPGLPALLKPLGYRSAFFTPADMAFERKDIILRNLGFETVRGHGSFPTEGFAVTNYFGYEDRIVLQPSLAWVDERLAAGEPFFLSYLTLVAHHPYHVPSSFPQRDFGVEDPLLNHYLNALRYTDALLRDLFGAFEARGLLSSTLFIVVGDHGQAFGEHMQRMHNDVLWDETLHVPALLFNPVLFPEGGRITGNRQHIDLLPTVADALNLRPEGGFFPGRSLLRPAPPGRTLYHSGWESDMGMALRRDSLKLMLRFQQPPLLAFDTRRDSLERHDIAGELPPERLRAAERELLRWRRSVQQRYEDHLRPLER